MAKNSVFDWSATAADNTDVGGVGITGNNLPSNLDDGIRTVMAQIKSFQTYLGITATDNKWTTAQIFTSTSANPNITVERTGNTVNSHIAYKTDAGTIYAGMGASMTWAVGSSTNLSSSPWFSVVSSGLATLIGTSPSIVLNDTGGGNARVSGDSSFGSIFIEADINNAFASTVIGFRIDGTDHGEIDNTGTMKFPPLGSSATGTRNGKTYGQDIIDSSRNGAGALAHMRFFNTNGGVGNIQTSASGTIFNTSSDGQLKVNRVALSEEIDVGAIFDALEPMAYDWLSTFGTPTGVRGYGLIAQDVYQVFPMAVTPGWGAPGDEDYQPWGMDNSKYAVILIAEVKSLRARAADLEARLAALEAGA